MRLLVLGGTRFIGRYLVRDALERGHRVTLFNRGRTDPEAFPGVEHVTGDRSEGLDALAGRTWDAVVDTSGYSAPDVRISTRALSGAVGRYTFVSTISVYRDFGVDGQDEDAPVHAPDREGGEHDGMRYGPMKVACEQIVRDAYGDRALIVRPTIVVGPHDYTDRFPYWVRRMRRGGEVLAPGDPSAPVQWIDARDLGAWTLTATERSLSGTFNALGPERPTTFGEMLEGIRDAVGGDARLTWVSDDFLHQRHAYLPLAHGPGYRGVHTLSNRRALDAGLTLRPLADTARAVAAWKRTTPPERPAGISPEHEAALLREWHAMRG